jgi:putative DNA primase/helicase
LEILCLADVTPRAIDWLWQNWIALGKVSVLAGDGGQGKSTILCDITARLTTGAKWPDGAAGCTAGAVIILAAEDDVADTLAPRLLAAGADMKLVFNVRAVKERDGKRRSFNLQADLAQLERLIEELARKGIHVLAVIIDPVSSYLGKVDSHKNAEVRTVLEPMGEMASRLHLAVVCNNHFSKGGGNANSRIIGSVAFVNHARAAFIVTPDAEIEGRYFLMPSKMNIAPIKHGLAYTIGSYLIYDKDNNPILTSQILWETTPVKMTADQALAAHDDRGEGKTAKGEATEFLRELLTPGEMAVKDAETAAKNAGITPKSLRSAKETLKVVTRREGFGPGAVYFLSLPDSMLAQNLHARPLLKVGEHGPEGRAWEDGASPKVPSEPDDGLGIPDFLDRRTWP